MTAVRVAVIGDGDLAAQFRSTPDVTVTGGTSLGALVDVQAVRRGATPDLIVMSSAVDRWPGIVGWVQNHVVDHVVVGPGDTAAAVLSRCHDQTATAAAVPSKPMLPTTSRRVPPPAKTTPAPPPPPPAPKLQ